jgi:hypothetical protein
VREAGVTLRRATGREASESDWDFFTDCYRRTYRAHRSTPYLNRAFFGRLGERMPDQVLLVIAEREGLPIAAALDLFGKERLYGRYWGATEFVPGFHFEACYYQRSSSPSSALAVGRRRAGRAQARAGFLPERTRSSTGSRISPQAVDDFLAREAGVSAYLTNRRHALSPRH